MTFSTADRSEIRRVALRSTAWSLAGFGCAQLLRFASNVLFAWLLYKEAFALMMLVNALTQGLQMLSDIGLGPSIVQSRRGDDPRFLGTAFSLQVLRGAVLAVLCLALAHPVTAVYAANDAAAVDLSRLFPYAALSVFVSSLTSTRIYTANRHLALRRVTIIDLASQLVAIFATCASALLHRDVIALVYGNLAGSTARVILSHVALPGRTDSFAWDLAAISSILRFGGWIFVSTVTSFFALHVDRLIFAGAFQLGESGTYHMAVSLALMLPAVVGSLQLAVMFPLYSRLEVEDEAIMPFLLTAKRSLLAVASVLVICMVAAGVPFVELVYDDRWIDAGWMVSLLAVGAWFSVIESIYGAGMLAKGATHWVALANAARLVTFLAIYMVNRYELTMQDVVLASVAADAVKGLLSMWGASQHRLLTLRLDLVATTSVLLLAGICWCLRSWVRSEFGTPPWLEVMGVASVAVAFYSQHLRRALEICTRR
jgi:O-antigen/teichoic acid export membrane protein